jgi:hypothetical protein
VGYSCEQRWFNLFVDIQAQQDAPTQDKDELIIIIMQRISFLNFVFDVPLTLPLATEEPRKQGIH